MISKRVHNETMRREIRTLVDVDSGPDCFALADYTSLFTVEGGLDHARHLNGETVGNASVDDGVRGNAPDGAGKNDVGLDITFLVSLEDDEVHGAVEGGVRNRAVDALGVIVAEDLLGSDKTVVGSIEHENTCA